MNYTFTRNDTALYLDSDGLWKRGAVNYPQATNDVDAIGTYFKGTWIPKALTNLFRDSEPASDPGQGTRTNVTFSACDWGLGFSTALDGMVTFGDNSTNRVYYNTDTLTASTLYSYGCIIKPNDGNVFTFGSGASNLGRFIIGNSTSATATVTSIGNGLYFVQGTGTSYTSSLSNTGIIKSTSNNAVGFEMSACMVVAGTVTWETAEDYLLDYIRTTGSSAARAVTDIRNTSFPLLSNLQGYIDVEIGGIGLSKRIINIGADNGNRIMISHLSTNTIVLAYVVGGVTQIQIVSSAYLSGRYRIGYYISNGLNILWVNGVESGRNTGAYSPQGSNLVLGGEITGTSNKLTNGGFFGQFLASGLSESEWLARCNDWGAYGDLAGFQRTP